MRKNSKLITTKKWFVYILECSDGSLYTGITNDLEKRLKAHNSGKGSKYVRSRLPARFVIFKECQNKSSALKLEAQIKKLPKNKKVKHLECVNEPYKFESTNFS